MEQARPRRRPTQPIRQSAEEGTLVVRKVVYGVETEDLHEAIRVPDFSGVVPARVRVSGSATRNLGDFNSARVEVTVELPCLPVMTEVERVYNICSSTVDDYIRRELEAALPPSAQIGGV